MLRDPEIDAVGIGVVWDPVWTKDRIRADARESMRRLGIAVWAVQTNRLGGVRPQGL